MFNTIKAITEKKILYAIGQGYGSFTGYIGLDTTYIYNFINYMSLGVQCLVPLLIKMESLAERLFHPVLSGKP